MDFYIFLTFIGSYRYFLDDKDHIYKDYTPLGQE